MTSNLAISVLTPTFGRTHVLSELIESFIRQDFDGRAELIVLNDHPKQTLTLSQDVTFGSDRRITIINKAERYPDLGTKRNALVNLASHGLVSFWDDDDIYLPSALSRVAASYLAHPRSRSGRESHCWQLQNAGGPKGLGDPVPLHNGLELIVRDSGPLWAAVVEKAAIREVGDFPADDRRQDSTLLAKLIRKTWAPYETNTPGIPACIHRLAGNDYTHAVHFSGWKSSADNPASAAFHASATDLLMESGLEPQGNIIIHPHWAYDYTALVAHAWVLYAPGRLTPRDVCNP